MINVAEIAQKILDEEGLGDILELKDEGDIGEHRVTYSSPPSEDGVHIRCYQTISPRGQLGIDSTDTERIKAAKRKLTGILDLVGVECLFFLERRPGSGEVRLPVDNNGKISGKLLYTPPNFIYSPYRYGNIFEDLDTSKGADFAPIFRRMVQVYKGTYTSGRVEVARIVR